MAARWGWTAIEPKVAAGQQESCLVQTMQIKTTVEHCMDTVARARQAFSVSDKKFTASKVQSWVWEYSVVRAFSVSKTPPPVHPNN
jgi:hypothetical protein